MQEALATGRVESLCINGISFDAIDFWLDGPQGDTHASLHRQLSGHDGDYIRTSDLTKGASVFNWRTWTGLSLEERVDVENILGRNIPQGCLLENITISGIPNFSELAPTTRLVFPRRDAVSGHTQTILTVWEKNGPCKTVGQRLEDHHKEPGLKTRFIAAAQNKRGVMGFVLAAGRVQLGDTILVYPPVR